MESARSRFEAILARSKNVGVDTSAVIKLSGTKKLFSLRKKPKSRWCFAALQGGSAGPAILIFLIFLSVGSFAPAPGPAFRQTFRYAISWWWGSDVRGLQCLFEMPSFVNKMTRPPMDCGICRDVEGVERVTNINPSLFEQRFAYSGRPLVVQDATTNWTAQQMFSFDFLRSLYAPPLTNGSSPTANAFGQSAARSSCQFLPYETEFRSLADFFAMEEERANQLTGQKPWYVGWSNCDGRVAQQLREHYGRPYFLPPLSENKNVDWIFMGSPGYGAQMHVDDVRHPSWQAQLRGTKLWSIEPPPECAYECKPFSVTVHPGEIIILDTNLWYHATKIVSEDVSITIGAEYD